ncbi:MAG: bifunctional acetaldehyde-CoA/alcohol dehydrogenase, partial [Firmicutes bacterium]|nr:bifunctional acetaldehyde-CoA/alcohol dehydrogenase [Bacillota bacterium]
APEDIIAWIDVPSLEMTNLVMSEADIILATGGPGMVKAAYSSGKPALGVGAGNKPVIIDDTADVRLAVNSIIHSKTFDNGMICASEQSVTVLAPIYDEVKNEFAKRGCYFLQGEELDKVRKTIIINGSLNAKIVGQSAYNIAKLANVEVPENTKVLIGEVESVDISEEFAHEKLSPVLAMYKAEDFDDAIKKAEQLVADGGYGHTSSLYINTAEKEKMAKHAAAMKTCRILVNTPSSHGGIGDLYNFMLKPSLTLGCGSWGGNSVSENVGVKHLLNIKTVAERRENMLWLRTPEKVYFKKGCMPVALDELGTVMGKKRAFIVTDTFLYQNGYTKPITDKLDELGIVYTCFSDVAPDPDISSAREGAKAMASFKPDVIIALGGGSAMDAGKIMWVLYEHPEADFLDMAMRFCDIRKRIYTFPKMGEKAYFVAIPTSSGTGSEVTPFAVITDGETGIKYPLADYELLPNMAIIDADNMANQPKGLTSASGIDALTHALEAYASVMATDYTDGLALKAMKSIFKYLPSAYENGSADMIAREKMADASTMAGMAFANAFLGVCHSMAHKLGAFHHLPHGVANALLITEVMRFNAEECPPKMGTFSQYQYPHTLERYVECANFCGFFGNDDKDTLEKFIAAIEELKAKVGIKKTIRDYGIDEKDFLDRLDEMVEQAFDDQCTGANPRYPLMSEIKAMYLKAYYGE